MSRLNLGKVALYELSYSRTGIGTQGTQPVSAAETAPATSGSIPMELHPLSARLYGLFLLASKPSINAPSSRSMVTVVAASSGTVAGASSLLSPSSRLAYLEERQGDATRITESGVYS